MAASDVGFDIFDPNLCIAIIGATLKTFPGLSMTILDSSDEFQGRGPVAVEILPRKRNHFFPPVCGKVQLGSKDVIYETGTTDLKVIPAPGLLPFACERHFYPQREMNCITNCKRIMVSTSDFKASLQAMGTVLDHVLVATKINSSDNCATPIWSVTDAFVNLLTQLDDNSYKICSGITKTEIKEYTLPGFNVTAKVTTYPAGGIRYESRACEIMYKENSVNFLPNQPFLRCKKCKTWIRNKLRIKSMEGRNQASTSRYTNLTNLTPKVTRQRLKEVAKQKSKLKQKLLRVKIKLNKFKLKLNEDQSKEIESIIASIHFRDEVNRKPVTLTGDFKNRSVNEVYRDSSELLMPQEEILPSDTDKFYDSITIENIQK